jgi:predicted amidohydrolase YtcJ
LSNSAGTLLINAKIWTGDPMHPEAQAVAFSGNRIVAVGSFETARAAVAADSLVLDLDGRRVVPGFNDSHVHFYMGGDSLTSVNLRDAQSQQEVRDRIAAFARTLPDGEWILNGSWIDQNWTPCNLPTHDLIDAVTPNHPVFVHRADGHMCLANSLAMKLAGVDRNAVDLPGGEIVRDANGYPTGVFKDTAKQLIERVIPPPSQQHILNSMRAAQRHAVEYGVTSIQDMGVLGKHGADTMADVLRAYQTLLQSGELQVRVLGHIPLSDWKRLAGLGVVAGFGNDKLRIGAVKSFSDGSLGSTTAWFSEPYTDAPQTCGLPSHELEDPEAWFQNVSQADRAGLRIAIHAIGDRANTTVLDLLERVRTENGEKDRRWRIEHAQHLRANDLRRFADLRVTASVQPYHAIEDGRWAEGRIGPERAKLTYAFRSLLDAGAVVAFGSDWWVAPINPLLGIYAAVTRRTLDGKNPQGWIPEQKISVAEAVHAYTAAAAYASGEEHLKGSIEVGKLADLAVLSEDIFSIEPERIQEAKVDMTIFDGRVIYDRTASGHVGRDF